VTATRLAAILAADVVGYSRLMGEDEAGTARLIGERRTVQLSLAWSCERCCGVLEAGGHETHFLGAEVSVVR
jgi:class 3 adenylate cyclase